MPPLSIFLNVQVRVAITETPMFVNISVIIDNSVTNDVSRTVFQGSALPGADLSLLAGGSQSVAVTCRST